MSSRLPLFTLKRDFDPSTLKTVKLEQAFEGGNKVKRECPIADGASIEGTLYTLADFLEIADELQFDTGPELFDHFRLVLRGASKDDWLNAVVENNPPRTVEGFNQTIEQWKRTFLHLDARQEMVDYLTHVTKPRSMTVREFVQRLKTLRRYTHMMPYNIYLKNSFTAV